MKKYLILFIILFSLGYLSAQSINFGDKKSLTSLLCSKTWIRYYVNNNNTLSDSTKDSIKFYTNGSFYKSASPKNSYQFTHQVETGKWNFGSTGKASRTDSASNYISIIMDCPHGNYISEFNIELYDGRKIQDKEIRKMCGNIEKPFLGYHWWRNDSLHSHGYLCYKQKK